MNYRTVEAIKTELEENRSVIESILRSQKLDINFSMDKMYKIIDDMADIKYSKSFTRKQYLVVTKGNPYTTVILVIQAMMMNLSITIDVSKKYLDLNATILRAFEKALNKSIFSRRLKLAKLVGSANNNERLKLDIDEIIVIDDKKIYDNMKDLGLKPRFVSMLNIEVLSNLANSDYLYDNMQDYANSNLFEIRIHKNIKKEEFLNKIEEEKAGNIIIVLLKDGARSSFENDEYLSIDFEKLESDDKKIYINKNPFSYLEEDVIDTEVFVL